MTNEEWDDWVRYHATLFGMKTVDDATLFREWRPRLNGFALHELREATMWIASNETTSAVFRTRHLAMLQSRVMSRRHAQRQARIDEEANKAAASRCGTCSGTGLVAVPHLKCVASGAWVYPFAELLVGCSCGLGRFKLESIAAAIAALNARGNTPKKRFDLISLEHYESILSDQGISWQELIATRKAQRHSHTMAQSIASQADRAAPIRVAEVLSRIGKK